VIRGPAGLAQAGFLFLCGDKMVCPVTLLRGGRGPDAPATGGYFPYLRCIMLHFVALEMLGIWVLIFGFVENKGRIGFEW
jgi:hypothetical protein